MFYLTKTL